MQPAANASPPKKEEPKATAPAPAADPKAQNGSFKLAQPPAQQPVAPPQKEEPKKQPVSPDPLTKKEVEEKQKLIEALSAQLDVLKMDTN